ncbi:hypothetical protein FRB94_004124 [Tulasnella sp. JGI-2019a]|nr:hypothetical protein FRB94_004124 [Tulasnella sp. JGI-2019a]
MEKFSTWRDAGTGIQPFLNPVPPLETAPFYVKLYRPLGIIIGILRGVLLVIPLALYGLAQLLSVILVLPPLRRLIPGLLVSISTRLALGLLGLWWISVETVTRKRSRSAPEVWDPVAGDIIISNWASWIELLWLAFRWNPMFILPVAQLPSITEGRTSSSNTTPGRWTGTGSAAIATPAATSANRSRVPILGWQRRSLLQMIAHTGQAVLTPEAAQNYGKIMSLEEIRSMTGRPLVIFPECTTSNGRAFLKFADVFNDVSIPVKGYSVFVMAVRYDPPTMTSPSLTHSVPTDLPFLPNPLSHVFQLLSSPTLARSLTIRLLAPSDSPSSASFMASEYYTPGSKDQLGEAISKLMEFLGKFKRTSVLGWEDKASFLTFYRSKTA